MNTEDLLSLMAAEFPHEPTPQQREAVCRLARFVASPREEAAFVLRGYAGTGKTSLVGALVRSLARLGRETVLLAPTGRAAKVFSAHAGRPAYTIHRVIYRQQTFSGEGTRFSLGYNARRGALFIVDEASMVARGGGGLFGSGLLLDDLVQFVYAGGGCRLLLVGDTAQLPPVGEEESPALSVACLRGYGLEAEDMELTEVVRQSKDSDVLAGATRLRRLLAAGSEELPRVRGDARGEVRFLPGGELIEALVGAYTDYGTQEVIVVTRSNKRANIYNQGIRARIFDREEELTRGDLVMAVKNNYYWTEQLQREMAAAEPGAVCPLPFIANGDCAEVVRVRGVHEQHGFRFAEATLRFADYGDAELTCRVLLDTLGSESPSLTAEQSRALYESVLADYADVPSKRERLKRVREDAYYNAVQIKYAYAVTCHKAQGGQWSRVFVDQGYLTPEMAGAPYLRWLYTAFTRTTDRLYLVNWPEEQREAPAAGTAGEEGA